jgi:hypothetical protein
MTRLGRLGPIAQAGLLTVILTICWLLAAPLAYRISGQNGILAASVGAGACWLGAQLAVAISALCGGSAGALNAMLLGMLGRMLLPLLIGVTLHVYVPALAHAGMIFYLMVFYLIVLASETLLMLAQVAATAPFRKPN